MLTPTARYIPKAERERLAREKEQQSIREEESRLKQQETQQIQWLDKVKDQAKNQSNTSKQTDTQKKKDEKRPLTNEEKELNSIRDHYLHVPVKKTVMKKATERSKLKFEWDDKDDTSVDTNDLYSNRHQIVPLFGRGNLAGLDRNELNMTKSVAFYDDLMLSRLNEDKGESRVRNDNIEDADLVLKAVMDGRKKQVEPEVRHWQDKKLEEMTEHDWRIVKEDFRISIRGRVNVHPIRSWAESGLASPLLQAVQYARYERPNPIQMISIPIGLQRRDLIGIAETGSGKTAAFCLPILHQILDLPRITRETLLEGPYALILAPTKELAQQIEDELLKFAKFCQGIDTMCIIGGQSYDQQSDRLSNNPIYVIVATPGRFKDLLERKMVVLSRCRFVVVDEADHMVDQSFISDVDWILSNIPDDLREHTQIMMYTATMPPQVEKLARTFLKTPIVVTVGERGMAVGNIQQSCLVVEDDKKKKEALMDVLRDATPPIIIFVNHRNTADKISVLCSDRFASGVLHGGKDQMTREATTDSFKKGELDLIVATDVFGRGIDIKDVQLVINYDAPESIESYTHRIGRTGRAGKKGAAMTILTPSDAEFAPKLKKMFIESNQFVPPELEMLERKAADSGTALASHQIIRD
ncbi:putative DEAD-box ATP-dependent RNA helicase 21 [Blattamonas nauphoetae]|uniref:RNA helicase n=1 Tax=Blattamonas nauphoetae TaxID=2049346 RepID=A0ABQ9XLL6_9EUKA|nr:putative DEAD-box ATP-dependent RNA helicase 21 [Blattamonas nauphoetae]